MTRKHRYNVTAPDGKERILIATSAPNALRTLCRLRNWCLREVRDTDNGWAAGEVYSRQSGEHVGTAESCRVA